MKQLPIVIERNMQYNFYVDFQKAFDEYRKNASSRSSGQKAKKDKIPSEYLFTDFETGRPFVKEIKISPEKKKNYVKAAKLLLLLGKEQSAEILKHFNENEIEEIAKEIIQIKQISKEEAFSFLSELGGSERKKEVFSGGVGTARDILVKTFGKEKGEKLLEKSLPKSREVPFDFLKDLDPGQIFLALKNETPAIISIVMGYMGYDKSAELLKEFPEEKKKEIILKMSESRRIGKEVITKIEEGIKEKVRLQGDAVAFPVDGKNKLANILKFMDPDSEENILKELSLKDKKLAADIKNSVYTIDIVKNITDIDLQKALKNFSDKDIALILKGQPEDIREKFFKNLSKTREESVKEESAFLGIMRKSEITKYIREFVEYLLNAEKNGEIMIDRGDLIF